MWKRKKCDDLEVNELIKYHVQGKATYKVSYGLYGLYSAKLIVYYGFKKYIIDGFSQYEEIEEIYKYDSSSLLIETCFSTILYNIYTGVRSNIKHGTLKHDGLDIGLNINDIENHQFCYYSDLEKPNKRIEELTKEIETLREEIRKMSYTDNPVHDFNMHDAEQEGKLQALQKCDLCGEPIQQEMAACFEGKYICDDCLAKLRRVI